MADTRHIAETRGHEVSAYLSAGGHDLHVAFAPGTDLDLSFEATCLDTGDRLTVNGWLYAAEPDEDGQPDESQEWGDFDPDC